MWLGWRSTNCWSTLSNPPRLPAAVSIPHPREAKLASLWLMVKGYPIPTPLQLQSIQPPLSLPLPLPPVLPSPQLSASWHQIIRWRPTHRHTSRSTLMSIPKSSTRSRSWTSQTWSLLGMCITAVTSWRRLAILSTSPFSILMLPSKFVCSNPDRISTPSRSSQSSMTSWKLDPEPGTSRSLNK